MNAAFEDVFRVLDEETLVRLSRRNSALQGRPVDANVTDRDVALVLRGFMAVLKEFAEGGGTQAMDLFFDTLVPVALAQGQGMATILASSVTYSLLLAGEVGAHVPPERRAAALEGLAQFYAVYTGQLVRKVSSL